MLDKMKQLMEMKKQADKIKKELDAQRVECEDVRGIKVTANGSQNILSIEISDDLFNSQNKEKFEAELQRSVNGALKKSQKVAAQRMQTMMPGGFPGF